MPRLDMLIRPLPTSTSPRLATVCPARLPGLLDDKPVGFWSCLFLCAVALLILLCIIKAFKVLNRSAGRRTPDSSWKNARLRGAGFALLALIGLVGLFVRGEMVAAARRHMAGIIFPETPPWNDSAKCPSPFSAQILEWCMEEVERLLLEHSRCSQDPHDRARIGQFAKWARTAVDQRTRFDSKRLEGAFDHAPSDLHYGVLAEASGATSQPICLYTDQIRDMFAARGIRSEREQAFALAYIIIHEAFHLDPLDGGLSSPCVPGDDLSNGRWVAHPKHIGLYSWTATIAASAERDSRPIVDATDESRARHVAACVELARTADLLSPDSPSPYAAELEALMRTGKVGVGESTGPRGWHVAPPPRMPAACGR